MKTGIRLMLAGACGLCCLAGTRAEAQTAEDERRSRALFNEGKQLAEAGRWTEACPKFQRAHVLNSTGGTALLAANCYEKIGEAARALPLYEFIVSRPDADENPERLAIAKERIRVLREQLSYSEPPPAPPPAPAATAPSAAPGPSAAPDPAPPPGPVAGEGGPSRTPAYVAFGVGGVGIAVGAVAGALALAQAGDVKSRCDGNRCLAEDEPNKDAAMAKGWVSTIGFGVGAAGIALGFVLLVTGSPAEGTVTADARGVMLRF
jgi:hypothetical protein